MVGTFLNMITLKTLEQATAQEVFDQVCEHLIQQNRPSCYFDGDYTFSLYRTKTGLKSAIGCLMSDEEYKPEFEIQEWETLVKNYNLPNAHFKLLKDLEWVHYDASLEEDGTFNNHNLRKDLSYVAYIHKLDSSKLGENYA